MKILSYNVNGIRAALKKDLVGYLKDSQAHVVCIQELKALQEQVEMEEIESIGYKHYWFSAQKKGYSGVGIWSKEEPKHIEYGCGHELFDFEGRVIRADFEECSVISAYFPSGTTGDVLLGKGQQHEMDQILGMFYTQRYQGKYYGTA